MIHCSERVSSRWWGSMVCEDEELFAELPVVSPRPVKEGAGAVRVQEACRDQIELQVVDLDSLVCEDHRVRAVWAFVESLDLGPLYDQVGSREHVAGRPPIDVKILMTLWLYATIEGLGSARQLAAFCKRDHVYRWICGGVSVNHHTLSDFRVAHGGFLDRLLSESVSALVSEGLVSLERLAQDGLKLRASAGAGSFRREERLEVLLEEAEARVAALKRELHDDPQASSRRKQAAQERAARERVSRIQAAQERLQELKAERERRAKTNKAEVAKQGKLRASTSDPDARVMKMADGGYRPAYNIQIAGDPESQVITGIGIDTKGSDRGRTTPMLEQHRRRYKRMPRDYLVDGGYTKNEAIEWAFDPDNGPTRLYCPPTKTKHKTDPYAPRRRDGPGVADWRERMASPQGQAILRERPLFECINAHLRNRGLIQLNVRRWVKAKTILLWHALAHNLLRMISLRQAKATP